MIKFEEIKKLDKRSLLQKKDELYRAILETRLLKSTTGIEKVHQFRATKRQLAQVLTAIAHGKLSNLKK